MKEINKIKRNPQCIFTIEQEKQIINDYMNKIGGGTILAKKYSCPVYVIYNILKAYNIPRRNLKEARKISSKIIVDENSFQLPLSKEGCYWLGVMYTDGYISKTSKYTNYFGISVKESDKEWLEKFKTYLKYSGEIKCYLSSSGYKENSPYVRLLIGNNKIVKDLEKLGCIEHKTKVISKIPDIYYIDDFIRGVIDGDGSINKTNGILRIYGNYKFLKEIGDYLKEPYSIDPDKSIFNLRYNTKESHAITKRLYENSLVYLDRKYELAKKNF